MLRISTEDYLWFVDQALDTMVGIVTELGDDDANRRPDLPGANSPYAILAHCVGVMEFWGGAMVAGRTVVRDREAEFQARGSVDALVERVAQGRRRLAEDLSALDSSAAPRAALRRRDRDLPLGRSQGGVLVHIYEELAQHLGHMELTRDLLLST
jgi:hypothetical protein